MPAAGFVPGWACNARTRRRPVLSAELPADAGSRRTARLSANQPFDMIYPLEERGALANCQAPGFNKPQRSGLIRTCPDRSTGSKPLEDVSLIGVSHSILKRVLRGTLKRTLDRKGRVTGFSFSRLAYIEHEHRSHSFFHVTFTRPSYGDQRKAAQAAESVSKCPGIVPEAGTHSHPIIAAPARGARLITSSTTR